MLFLKKTMMLLMLCLTLAAAKAQQQESAPAFKAFSASISFEESALGKTMQMEKGQQAEIAFGNELKISGEVISNINVYDNLQTVIIRSAEYNNALVQVSKQLNADGTINYVGRIFSPGAADGFEIKRSAEGAYSLQKFETAAILQDCSMK
jgi:hypothetical protein